MSAVNMNCFGEHRPFTVADAESYSEEEVMVKISDAGVERIYYGTMAVQGNNAIVVGEELLLNDTVRYVDFIS